MLSNRIVDSGGLSISELIAMRDSLTDKSGPSSINENCQEPTKSLLEISLDKYQEAITFYIDHPNQDLYRSYSESLLVCQELKPLFDLLHELSVLSEQAKKDRSLKGMNREENLSKYTMERVNLLMKVQGIKSRLSKLKSERSSIRKMTKPQ